MIIENPLIYYKWFY